MMIVFAFFLALSIFTVLLPFERSALLSRSRNEWILDCLGLFMQGVLIPFLQIFLSARLFTFLLPTLHRSVDLPAWLAFLINFLGVDYLYYWNHRILHHRNFWPLHVVHHASTQLDLIMTSRNSLWTPFFLVNLWINGFFIFLLKDPTWFVVGASISAGLDLWRHTRFSPKTDNGFLKTLSWIFIFPRDHAWHHSRDVYDVNFGANLKLWDRLHGTCHANQTIAPEIGTPISMGLLRQVFWPFGRKHS